MLAIHAIYFKGPGNFEFKARAALVLTPEQFRQFIWVLTLMLAEPARAIVISGWML